MSWLFFDLDDTLYDAEAVYAASLKSVGVDSKGQEFAAARTVVKNTLAPGHVSSRNRYLYFKAYLDLRGEYTNRRCLDLTESYEKQVVHHVRAQWSALGHAPILEALAARYSLGLITNETVRTQLLKLQVIDPDNRLFASVTISEETGFEKPSPEIFRYALKRTGARAEESWMIGDRLDFDVAPAQRLGMKTVLSQQFQQWNDARAGATPDHTITRLDQLEALL